MKNRKKWTEFSSILRFCPDRFFAPANGVLHMRLLHLRKHLAGAYFPSLPGTAPAEEVLASAQAQVRPFLRTCASGLHTCAFAGAPIYFAPAMAGQAPLLRACGCPSAGANVPETEGFSSSSKFQSWSEPRPVNTQGSRSPARTYQQV